MKTILAAMLGTAAALATVSARAGELEDIHARLEQLERQNAAIRKENAALRENQRLHAENMRLKTQDARAVIEPVSRATRSRQETSALPAVSAVSRQTRDPLESYAADFPVKARPMAGPGLFRAWIEGGAIFSGGDPVSGFAGNNDEFDLTPKLGWEAAVGFDYRFAGSPWHVSGQFRYGDGGKTSGLAVTSASLAIGGATQTQTETWASSYNETHWLTDLAVGRDIAGSGPAALQLKGGVRVAEFVTRTSTSHITTTSGSGLPPIVVPGFPTVTAFSSTQSVLGDSRASFLGVGPLIGVEGSIPFAGQWSFDYAADAALLFGRQQQTGRSRDQLVYSPSYLSLVFPTFDNLTTSSDHLFAGVLSADIQVGVSYWLTQNLKLGAGYRLDTFINVFNQAGSSNNNLTPDRYTHGPRVTLTGQFDAM